MKLFKPLLISIIITVFTVQLNAKEFLNTILHVNFGAAYSFPFGDIIDFEHDNYFIESQDNSKVRPSHYDSSYTVFADFAPFPPLILGNEAHAFKFGIRACYRMHYLKQKITITSNNDEKNYEGVLIDYNRWMVGPVIRYAPDISPKGINNEYSATGGFTAYALYGRLTSGKLTAFPSWRDNDNDTPPSTDYETNISGYAIDIGIGGEISICAVNLGANIYYSYISIDLDEAVYETFANSQGNTTSLRKSTSIQQITFEVYMGIPIEW